MALFSDIDWAILLIAGGFLLLGRENGALLRTLGRYYGRAMRLKRELLDEVRRAADLPNTGAPMPSLRASLLGVEPPGPSGIPSAVPRAPVVPPYEVSHAWAGAVGLPTWSVASPGSAIESGRLP